MREVRIALVSCLLLLTVTGRGQRRVPSVQGTEPNLVFAVSEHDFGEIKEEDGEVSFDYPFENTGTAPLILTKVIVSCRCTRADYSKKPVPPGGTGCVTITYNPRKQQGVFYKAIQVYSNSPERRQIIIAKGEVIPEPIKEGENEYTD